jgi:hypothetical protein
MRGCNDTSLERADRKKMMCFNVGRMPFSWSFAFRSIEITHILKERNTTKNIDKNQAKTTATLPDVE